MQREVAAARLTRRAGDVHLDHVDFRPGDVARHRREVVGGRGGDVGDNRRRVAPVVGELVFEEIREPLPRQADRVDHAAFKLGDARRRIADAIFARHRLGDQRAEAVDVHHLGKLGRERARGGHDRVLERDAPDPDRHVYHPIASCRSNTGPSMQTRRSTFSPSTSNVFTHT